MAYRLLIKKRFADNVEQVHHYLRSEWNEAIAARFLELIEIRLMMLKEHPLLGASSDKIKGVRSIFVTKHNRLFYKIDNEMIVILYLKDTRQKNFQR